MALDAVKVVPGLAFWAAALALAWALPGHLWHASPPPPFPFAALLPTTLGLLALSLLTPLLVWALGPNLARRRSLGVLEAPPDFVWALLLLALWPAAAGPPGWLAWIIVLLVAALPSEVRWLSSTLPAETPFPTVWGGAATRVSRFHTLRRLLPRWLAARLPLWLTASLITERVLGLPGLGSDWMARVALRDHAGLAAWVLAFAALWFLARPRPKRPA
ncbi:MAG: hypothetical protein JST24_07150 [Acidobacteria bacterium]|nr:hypothetical protein [Acidobacteriota bacterium]